MFEHEVDSDDDFEGYFLQPVNGYNIVDRIKEANKELFATPEPPSPSQLGPARKVKFRDVLEDYDEAPNECLIETPPPPTIPEEEVEDSPPETSLETESTVSSTANLKSEEHSFFMNSVQKSMSADTSDHEIEEICEEIVSLEIENVAAESVSETDLSSIRNESIDCIQENEVCSNEKFDHMIRKQSTEESTTYSRTSDDELSVIVATYVVENPKAKFVDDDEKPRSGLGSRNKFATIKPKRKPAHQRVSDILKLRLNYKTCCEYKNAYEEQLPRYNGYYSQYGLTKEQWEKREERVEKCRKRFMDKTVRCNEEHGKKNEDNEKAFTNWLKNKMRFPINKTKNMFDFKPIRQKKPKIKSM